jgi:phosphonoacetaldehyde hydrolase
MLDWAGTTVDHGSIAPVIALQTLFADHNISLSTEDARRDMGLLKRDHIHTILQLSNIQAEWQNLYGRLPAREDVDALYSEFGPLQMQIISQHSQVIAGVAHTVARWQQSGLKIGSTTGYTRAMLAPVLAQAAKQGYRPDASVCPDEVGAGRPKPWMLTRNMQLLDIYPPSQCVKIGDTISDIEEGRNAGMWTIGLTRTGNMIGLSAPEFNALPHDEQHRLIAGAEEKLRQSGADFIAEDLPSCESLLAGINELLSKNRHHHHP